MHSAAPMAVGRATARAVHFALFVSRQMVRHVVPQGKWKRVNSMAHRAVAVVQPLAARMPRSSARLP